MSLTMEMYTIHEISDITGNMQEMSCVLVLQMSMKCKISDAAGYVQEMYSKCHVSLILEMCRIHEMSDSAGNVQEISCVLAWNCT